MPSRPIPLARSDYHHLYCRAAWRRLRLAQLQREPLCEFCSLTGRTTVATVADHIVRHEGDLDLFHDPLNLQSLCAPCHDGPKARIEAGEAFLTLIDGSGYVTRLPYDPAAILAQRRAA